MGAHKPILVVDDDEDLRQVLAEVLREAGYSVLTAVNGREALITMETIEPCMILLDLMMPVMNGEEFLHTRSETGSKIPVLIMTAFRDRFAGIEDADLDILEKPFGDIRRVLNIVEKYC